MGIFQPPLRAKCVRVRSEPATLGRGIPQVQEMRGLYAVKLLINQPKLDVSYRTMVDRWKGKVRMLETVSSNWELRPSVMLSSRLSEEEAKQVVGFLEKHFPSGIDLGEVVELNLLENAPSNGNPYILDTPGLRAEDENY